MKELETLKKQAEMLETKSLIYFNELGDKGAYERLQNELREVNERILRLMVLESEMDRFEAFISNQ